MHKITNSERNRVVSILDDSIERIMLLSYVPERAHEAVLAELEPGPYDVFSRHWELEAKGEAAALQESAREVCRCLRDSPRTFAVLQRYGRARPVRVQGLRGRVAGSEGGCGKTARRDGAAPAAAGGGFE